MEQRHSSFHTAKPVPTPNEGHFYVMQRWPSSGMGVFDWAWIWDMAQFAASPSNIMEAAFGRHCCGIHNAGWGGDYDFDLIFLWGGTRHPHPNPTHPTPSPK